MTRYPVRSAPGPFRRNVAGYLQLTRTSRTSAKAFTGRAGTGRKGSPAHSRLCPPLHSVPRRNDSSHLRTVCFRIPRDVNRFLITHNIRPSWSYIMRQGFRATFRAWPDPSSLDSAKWPSSSDAPPSRSAGTAGRLARNCSRWAAWPALRAARCT